MNLYKHVSDSINKKLGFEAKLAFDTLATTIDLMGLKIPSEM